MAMPTVRWPRPLEVPFESLAGAVVTYVPRGSRLQQDADRCCDRYGSGFKNHHRAWSPETAKPLL